MDSIKEGVTFLKESIASGIVNIFNSISDFCSSVGSWFSDLFDKLGSWFSNLFDKLGSWFSDLFNNIVNLGSTIIDGFLNILKLIFVPSADFLSEKVNAIKSHFDFVDTFKEYANLITNFNGSSVSFNISTGGELLGVNLPGSFNFNLGWYAPYKSMGDIVITAFCYVMFIWRIFIKLPSIISGAGGFISAEGRMIENDIKDK